MKGRFNFSLSEDTSLRLDDICKETGEGRSAVVERLIAACVPPVAPSAPKPALQAPAMDVCRCRGAGCDVCGNRPHHEVIARVTAHDKHAKLRQEASDALELAKLGLRFERGRATPGRPSPAVARDEALVAQWEACLAAIDAHPGA